MQTRDEIRTQVQNQIRDAMRGAEDAVREASAQAQADPNLVLTLLGSQLEAAQNRVNQLTQQIADPGLSGPARDALVSALQQEQSNLANLQAQFTSSTQGRGGTTQPAFPPMPRERGLTDNELGAIFFVAAAMTIVLFPIARAFARWFDRRGTTAPTSADTGKRLERIEQAIEAVAIEVERVSEGQRYNTKLMADMKGLPAPNPLNEWHAPEARVPVAAATPRKE